MPLSRGLKRTGIKAHGEGSTVYVFNCTVPQKRLGEAHILASHPQRVSVRVNPEGTQMSRSQQQGIHLSMALAGPRGLLTTPEASSTSKAALVEYEPPNPHISELASEKHFTCY